MFVARAAIAASIVSLAVSFVAFLALLPAEVAIQVESRAFSSIEQNAPPQQEVAKDRTTLSGSQQLLNVLGPYVSTSSAALDAMRAVVGDRPPGLVITSLSYVAGSKTITVVGQGSTVSSFGTELQADPHFTGVNIPVGVLVGSNKKFSITLTGNF